MFCFILACSPALKKREVSLEKVHIVDLHKINEQGLKGPRDGLVAVHYEFCIPNTSQHRKEIESIDSTITFQYARGRIGCTKEQILCLGHTAQPHFREVLQKLSDKDYIFRIEQAWFE